MSIELSAGLSVLISPAHEQFSAKSGSSMWFGRRAAALALTGQMELGRAECRV